MPEFSYTVTMAVSLKRLTRDTIIFIVEILPCIRVSRIVDKAENIFLPKKKHHGGFYCDKIKDLIIIQYLQIEFYRL